MHKNFLLDVMMLAAEFPPPKNKISMSITLSVRTSKISSTFFKSVASLVKGLIVLVKLTHDDRLQSQDAVL